MIIRYIYDPGIFHTPFANINKCSVLKTVNNFIFVINTIVVMDRSVVV